MDDPSRAPEARWYAHAQLLYTNWLNYYVYQTTPYDVSRVGVDDADENMMPHITAETAKHIDAKGAVARAGAPAGRILAENSDTYARPEREDDDGYDPWSDRREESPLFEEDPWN